MACEGNSIVGSDYLVSQVVGVVLAPL